MSMKTLYFKDTFIVMTIALLTVAFIMAGVGVGQAKSKNRLSQAIRITSDKMEAFDQQGLVVFTGHVVAKKGNLTIYADRLEVFYNNKSDSDKKKRRLKKIVAKGHLKIVQGRRKAKALEAIYYKPQEKIVLLKDAQVWDGPSSIKGDKIVFYVNEDRSVVESSGKKRVEALVYSEGD